MSTSITTGTEDGGTATQDGVAGKISVMADADVGGEEDVGENRERDEETIGRRRASDQSTSKQRQPTLSSEARWEDLKDHTMEKQYVEQQLNNKNDVKSRWQRAAHAAARLEHGDGLKASPIPDDVVEPPPELDEETRQARKATFWGSLSLGVGKERDENEELPYQSKELEQQHWLEMIDGKHRYGSNMKYYFRVWKESETEDNFFRWLDRGEGKNLDLEVLPRERLETEKILYLSAEQRLNYLVKVDKDGLLRWARNDELVDTARGQWRDAGNGGGIVPNDTDSYDDDAQENGGNVDEDTESLSDLSSSYSAASDLHDNEDTHYVGLDKPNNGNWFTRQKKKLGPQGVKKQLLRKTVRRNTWIYVSDLQMNFFVGIKKSGEFQHSSFLAGGKVTSAGIIVVKRGLIKSLNPLSGHYRSSIKHYRSFISQMENKGVDLSHVKIAKSVLSLWGLGKYASVTKNEKDMVSRFKSAIGLSHEPTELEKSQKLKENAAAEEAEHQERLQKIKSAEEEEDSVEGKAKARREVLYGRKREKEEKKEDTAEELRPA